MTASVLQWLLLPLRKLPVSHIRRRSAPHLSQPRRGLRDEHALRSLQRSVRPARTRPPLPPLPATLTSRCRRAFFTSGILYGTMTLELGGQITVACEKTGYSAQLEFKLKVRPARDCSRRPGDFRFATVLLSETTKSRYVLFNGKPPCWRF